MLLAAPFPNLSAANSGHLQVSGRNLASSNGLSFRRSLRIFPLAHLVPFFSFIYHPFLSVSFIRIFRQAYCQSIVTMKNHYTFIIKKPSSLKIQGTKAVFAFAVPPKFSGRFIVLVWLRWLVHVNLLSKGIFEANY